MAIHLPKWTPPVTVDGTVHIKGRDGKTLEVKVDPEVAAKLSEQIAAQERLALQTAGS